MTSELVIEREVMTVLRTLTPRGIPIDRQHRIIQDLKLLSDDATAMALDLERKFHIKIPPSEWSAVFTVQDVIDLFCRKLGAAPPNASQ